MCEPATEKFWRHLCGGSKLRMGDMPAQVANVQLKRTGGGFLLTFTSEHKQGDIDFVWNGTLTGSGEGTLKFTFDGKARSTFQRNRIGFCVLHPMRECAGQPCTVEKATGESVKASFPDLIAPNQPFLDVRAIHHTVWPGVAAVVRMDVETEDHRNWTDANFEIYCTPLAKPFPVRVESGTTIQQAVTLTVRGAAPRASARREAPAEVRINSDRRPMPEIGFGFAPVNAKSTAAIRALEPAHLRVDLHTSKPDWKDALAAAGALGIPLEVAIFGAPDAVLATVPKNVARYLIFDFTYPPPKLNRQVLIGTNDYFTELNRKRPDKDAGDGTGYSINPQVHAFDNATLVENLEAQASTVRTARSFAGDRWIAVTPVTLRPRFIPANGAPVDPDPRQSLPFNAAWTLGSIKYLAEAGANSVTYYELVGKGGVLGYPVEEYSQLSRAPTAFCSPSQATRCE
jgi:D-apionolactonase